MAGTSPGGSVVAGSVTASLSPLMAAIPERQPVPLIPMSTLLLWRLAR